MLTEDVRRLMHDYRHTVRYVAFVVTVILLLQILEVVMTW